MCSKLDKEMEEGGLHWGKGVWGEKTNHSIERVQSTVRELQVIQSLLSSEG